MHGEDMNDVIKLVLCIPTGSPEVQSEGFGEGGTTKGHEPDWKALAKQLLQTISMMDTSSDAAMEGEMSDEEAIKAIDQMTSRVLWGKQEKDNPASSYQNANYTEHAAVGMMMDNEGDDKDEDNEGDDKKPQGPFGMKEGDDDGEEEEEGLQIKPGKLKDSAMSALKKGKHNGF
jgi:hypothetical protein